MRLCDLDILKESVQNICKTYTEMSANQLGYDILRIIDNAPIVEPTYVSDMPDDKVKDLKELAIDYGEGIVVFERKRPKGEWIEKLDYNRDTYYDCSVCGNSWTTIEGTPWDNGMNFCPNCGAEMEGGEENDNKV